MGGIARGSVTTGLLLLAVCCGARRPAAEPSGAARFGFADVIAAHGEFVAAKNTLAGMEARGGAADPGALRAARARFDAAYEHDQKGLAVFLTLAVNERPQAPETREGLRLYAQGAAANARWLLGHGSDPARALRVLEGAERPFRALGIALPPELAAALADARGRQGARSAVPESVRGTSFGGGD
jgi:hypothetical protein